MDEIFRRMMATLTTSELRQLRALVDELLQIEEQGGIQEARPKIVPKLRPKLRGASGPSGRKER